jgi:hypothetical protein
MKTLEQQLLEYGAFHEREQGALSADDAARVRTVLIGDPTVNRRPWRVVAAAAAAVLILIGGISLLSRTGTDLNAPPAQEQIDPSQLLESGTVTTPTGDARWVRLTGIGSSVPRGVAVTWPNGFAIFSSRPARLWLSPDGVEWQVEPLPVADGAEGVTLTLAGGQYWLLSSVPNQIWRSTDGVTWVEYDSSELRPPIPPGLFGNLFGGMSYDPPVTGNGLTLSSAQYRANLPVQEYLSQLIDGFNLFSSRDSSCNRLLKVEPGVFQVVGQEGDQPCPHQVSLRFEETGNGLRVHDNATGTIVGELLGADLSHIERLAQANDGSYTEGRILILGNSKITQVESPWPSFSLVELFGTDDWVYAYVADRTDTDTRLTVWRTDDGQSWINLGAPSFLQDAPAPDYVRFWPLEGSLAVTTFNYSDDGSNSNVGWESPDGITWEPEPSGRPNDTNIVRLESGWFANDGSQGGPYDGNAWWSYIDGTWVSLADLGMEQTQRCVNATGVENTTFFSRGSCNYREEGARDLWILTLEPSG